jgi:hypothetical protein
MDALERYRRAQEAAHDGRHEEALREYRWFHDHALEAQPSLYGVRLSFALSAWLDLAKAYPKALDALKDIRDRKTRRLVDGEGDRELFHDVESINEHLGDFRATYELFLQLRANNPTLAEECAGLAMPAIVNAKDYGLARELVGDPAGKIRKWSSVLNQDIADLAKEPPREAPVQDAYVHIYAERVGLLLTVLNGVGEHAHANSIRQVALASVESAAVREAVADALSDGAEA